MRHESKMANITCTQESPIISINAECFNLCIRQNKAMF